MFSQSLSSFFVSHQEVLWLTTLLLDLGFTLLLYRWFGVAGLQVAIATAIVLANLQGPKLTEVFGLETSLGVIFYSAIFFATDILSENHGRDKANQAVMLGFVVSVIVVTMLSIGVLFQPSSNPDTAAFAASVHGAFNTIINFSPRFVAGSLLAYLISQRLDVWVFHKVRQLTRGRSLWLRNNVSTLTSQMVDTAIYSLIVWWGVVDLATALKLGAAKYVFKLAIALIDTPFLYLARRMRPPRTAPQ
ncbi:MAG: queuosine precursor transporter [Pseudomonadota bacterium]